MNLFENLFALKEDGIPYQELPLRAFDMLACDVDALEDWLKKSKMLMKR